MKMNRKVFFVVMVIGLSLFLLPRESWAGTCSSPAAGGTSSSVASDLEARLPQLDTLALVSREQMAALGGYARPSFLGIPLGSWQFVGLRGSPIIERSIYRTGDGLMVWMDTPLSGGVDYSVMWWDVRGEEPGSLAMMLLKIEDRKHFHVALVDLDGSYQIFEGTRILIESDSAEIVSSINVRVCDNGEEITLRTTVLPNPIQVRKHNLRNSNLDFYCRKEN